MKKRTKQTRLSRRNPETLFSGLCQVLGAIRNKVNRLAVLTMFPTGLISLLLDISPASPKFSKGSSSPLIFSMSFQSKHFASIILRPNPLRQAASPRFLLIFYPKPQKPDPFPRLFPFSLFILSKTAAPPACQKSLIITKHFLDFKII